MILTSDREDFFRLEMACCCLWLVLPVVAPMAPLDGVIGGAGDDDSDSDEVECACGMLWAEWDVIVVRSDQSSGEFSLFYGKVNTIQCTLCSHFNAYAINK